MDEFKLLFELNSVHVNMIADKIIQELIELTDKDFLLSGNDSGLKNVWEEICVQKQGEESHYWDAYEDTINNFIDAEFQIQQEPVKKLIRYFGSLSNNNFNNGDEYDGSDEDAIEEIKSVIIERATNFRNANIDKFFRR